MRQLGPLVAYRVHRERGHYRGHVVVDVRRRREAAVYVAQCIAAIVEDVGRESLCSLDGRAEAGHLVFYSSAAATYGAVVEARP